MGTCYLKLNNTLTTPSTWKPCGKSNSTSPYVPCCADGDYCLTNGLCGYTHSVLGSSGLYAGGCTDKSYKDNSCPVLCNAQGKKDVVFRTSNNLWSCCGGPQNGQTHCDKPTDDNFAAPPPSKLQTYYEAGTGPIATPSKTSSTSRSTTTSRPTTLITSTGPVITQPPSSASPTPSSSPGLSAGAAGGIGAGVAVAVLSVSAVLFWFWRRRRRAQGANVETAYAPVEGRATPPVVLPHQEDAKKMTTPPPMASDRAELPQTPMLELPTRKSFPVQNPQGVQQTQHPQELPADVPREGIARR